MHIQVPHKLSQAGAVQNIKKALDENRSKLDGHATIDHEEWQDSTLHFAVNLQGKKITGTLAITDSEYVLDATLPLLWRMFEGRIEAEVKKQVEQLSKN